MKNIALFIPSLSHGGAERVVSRMSSILSSEYNVIVIIYNGDKVGYPIDCPIICMNYPLGDMVFIKKVYHAIRKCIAFSRIIKTNRIDLCLSFGDSTNIISLLTKVNAKRLISLRGYARIRKNTTIANTIFYVPLYKILYRRANKVVCVSEIMKNEVISTYKLDPLKVMTLYNPFDLHNINMLASESIEEEVMNYIKDKKVIISVGTIRYPKGYWHLVRAFAVVKSKRPDTVLLIIGAGDQPYKDKLIRLINELNLQDSVILREFDPNPFKYMAISDLYVLSSISEGFPNSLVEAMACSLPVIATDCKTGPREILAPETINSTAKSIEYHRWGILIPPFDETEDYSPLTFNEREQNLVDSIINLLSDDVMRQQYSQRSKKRASDFDCTIWAEQIKALIEPYICS